MDFGNIKLAFTQVCKDELFKDVYFAANSLYYVECGKATFYTTNGKVMIERGEIVLIKQHSKLNIRKYRDDDGRDFKSIIFYLFPDFVSACIKENKKKASSTSTIRTDIVSLGKQKRFQNFCTSLLPLFEESKLHYSIIKKKTYEAINLLSGDNEEFLSFLTQHAQPLKIDLYEFMIHNILTDYSTEDFAKLTGRSLSAFKRDFKVIFDKTPYQWVLDEKLNYAEHLIKYEQMQASDIYMMLGFNELSNFSAAFKKAKGVSPSKI
jgi:AraC-like DNA-binding protein